MLPNQLIRAAVQLVNQCFLGNFVNANKLFIYIKTIVSVCKLKKGKRKKAYNKAIKKKGKKVKKVFLLANKAIVNVAAAGFGKQS